MERPIRTRLILPSNSSSEIDDSDQDPDFIPGSPNEPRPRYFLNVLNNNINRRPRIVSDSSSQSDSDEFIGPINQTKTKKRVKNTKEYKGNKSKRMRNSGQRYINKLGHVIEGKQFSNIPCNCKENCQNKISEQERQSMFQNFWKMADFSRQNAFLCGLIQKQEIKQRRPRKEGGVVRSGAFKYNLKLNNGISCTVCKKYFLQTYCVSNGRVARALKKVSEARSPGEDLRGNKGCPSRKISSQDIEFVCDHIRAFPSYQSHYTRHHNEHRKYLCESINLRKMYLLYCEKCTNDNRLPVKEHYYRYLFNTKFNLHFYVPKKDTCKKCDIFKIQISNNGLSDEEKQALEAAHEHHLRKAEKSRACMKEDGELAKSNPDTYVISMDLQKALPFPVLTVSDAYYTRNMYCYNFGIHNLSTDSGIFYVWDETVASRGSQEISSCLLKHIKSQAQHKKHVVIYSDTCAGQNRNFNVTLSLMTLLQTNETDIETIEQKFLVPGHSYMPNDADFGSVELAAKGKVIYVPHQWYDIMATCRRKKKIIICEMKSEDFFSTSNLERNISKRKKNENKMPVNWLKIQWIKVIKNRPYDILYKETLSDLLEFEVLNIKPTGRKGRPLLLQNVPVENLYNGVRPVGELKKRDMINLLKFIPPVYHRFFTDLTTTAAEDEIGPLPYIEEEVPEEDSD